MMFAAVCLFRKVHISAIAVKSHVYQRQSGAPADTLSNLCMIVFCSMAESPSAA
jgi:hypothetical protein